MKGPAAGRRRGKRAILWDSDGVLVRTEELYWLATRDVLDFLGVVLDRQGYNHLFMCENIDPLQLALRQRKRGDAELADLHRTRLRRYSELLESEDIRVEGASETIHGLADEYVMGVVTGSKREHIRVLEARTDFYHLFDFVITLDDVSETKPNPEPYVQAIHRSGASVDECLAIEDSERGLKSAKSAGLECWIIPNQLTRDSNFDSADRMIGSIRDVRSLL